MVFEGTYDDWTSKMIGVGHLVGTWAAGKTSLIIRLWEAFQGKLRLHNSKVLRNKLIKNNALFLDKVPRLNDFKSDNEISMTTELDTLFFEHQSPETGKSSYYGVYAVGGQDLGQIHGFAEQSLFMPRKRFIGVVFDLYAHRTHSNSKGDNPQKRQFNDINRFMEMITNACEVTDCSKLKFFLIVTKRDLLGMSYNESWAVVKKARAWLAQTIDYWLGNGITAEDIEAFDVCLRRDSAEFETDENLNALAKLLDTMVNEITRPDSERDASVLL